jgi:hypothetical protein
MKTKKKLMPKMQDGGKVRTPKDSTVRVETKPITVEKEKKVTPKREEKINAYITKTNIKLKSPEMKKGGSVKKKK